MKKGAPVFQSAPLPSQKPCEFQSYPHQHRGQSDPNGQAVLRPQGLLASMAKVSVIRSSFVVVRVPLDEPNAAHKANVG